MTLRKLRKWDGRMQELQEYRRPWGRRKKELEEKVSWICWPENKNEWTKICENSSPSLFDICFRRMKLEPLFSCTQKCTHCPTPPVLQPWGCNQKILLPLSQLKPDRSDLPCGVDNSHISVQQQVDGAESAVMTSDRQTDCRCARVRSINVTKWIMLLFGLTSLSVFGKTQERPFIIISVSLESYYQQMLLARLGCCCQWPAVCFISMIEIYIYKYAHKLTITYTHTFCFQAKPKPRTVHCSCRMIGVTSQSFLHHGQHPDSQLCMVSISPTHRSLHGKFTKITALTQLPVNQNCVYM